MSRAISEKAFHIFSYAKSFHILSSHKNLINVDTDKGLFTIQTDRVPLTPFALVVDDAYLYSLKHSLDSKPFNNDNSFRTELLASVEPSSIYSSRLSMESTLSILEMKKLQHAITEGLFQENHSDGLQDLSTTITFLESGLQITSSEDSMLGTFVRSKLQGALYHELPYLITSMIGLGSGLTPSMDDFIVGLLSALTYLDASRRLKVHRELLEFTEYKRHATNRVSESFLESAVEGQFAQPVLAFYDAVSSKNWNSVETAIHRIIRIGHTSGADSLNGILFGMKLYSSNFLK